MATRDEDRAQASMQDLTDQVSRLAWAVEALTLGNCDDETIAKFFEAAPCPHCGSQLVLRAKALCPACFEPKKEGTDAG